MNEASPCEGGEDLGFTPATCSFRDFVSQLDSFTENGTYFTAENLNKPSDDIPAFSVFHLNVRSLNKHANELVSLLSSIKISFDIICLTEVHNTNLDHFSSLLNGYVYHPVPSLRGNVGGVCVYVKADIKFEVLHDLTFICQSPCENLWFTVSRDKVETIMGLIYRHPDGSIKDFCEKLEFTLDKISKTKFKQGILIGDINIDLLKYNDSKYKPVKEYLDLLIAHSFFPQTILPSRVTKNTFSLVDHIFLFQQHHSAKIEAGNLITDISDHFASILILKENTSSAKTAPKVRCFSEKNRARFQEKIQKINWNDVLKCKDANRCTVIFNNNLTQCFNDCFPLRILPQKRLKDKPWVNKGLRKCIQKKNRLYKHSVKFKDEVSISKYKKYKNILTACLRQAEINYFNGILKDKANAIFRMWSIMGPMLNPKKSKQTIRIAKLIDKSKRSWMSDAHIASLLNNFFCNIGRKVNSMVDPTRTPFTEYLRNPNEHSFFLSKVTVEEVLNEINRIKPGKAAGYDNIRPDLIKDCYESLVTPLTYIYNVSFLTGVFPDIWKIAKVIPVFKKRRSK